MFDLKPLPAIQRLALIAVVVCGVVHEGQQAETSGKLDFKQIKITEVKEIIFLFNEYCGLRVIIAQCNDNWQFQGSIFGLGKPATP